MVVYDSTNTCIPAFPTPGVRGGASIARGSPRTVGQKPEPTIRRGTNGRRAGACSQKGKGGYGILHYDIVKIYLFLRREQAPALRYKIAFSAKNAEASVL